MRTDTAVAVSLADYRPPDFLIDAVHLDIRLQGDEADVRSFLNVRRNPLGMRNAPLSFDGEDITLIALALDGVRLPDEAFTIADGKLVIPRAPDAFTLSVETRIDLAANTRLMGLYRSNGVYCTQCEAEGFRRITFYPDRPDVLAVFTVRVEADAPVILANGNLIEQGAADGGRRFAIWRDPFPKPCYLFAIVAGELEKTSAAFTTCSGRSVELNVYVEPGKRERAHYALDALRRSMAWDEHAFGREYDLDVFNIVAVSDFNFGAMENKGLNIFNDRYVLASPDTATDADYAGIEAVIAHEYFHNWSGNRVTCRDWFQLCLKEGLTVYRDQEFTAAMRSRPVKRVQDVRALRSQQFSEDASPLAHPVRPQTYSEINNFYTVTIYEKGAELVRMLATLAGPTATRAAMDLYYERCDGTAATVEDFVGAFESVMNRDLGKFMRWYAQAGTPTLTAESSYEPSTRTLTLHLSQDTKPTPGQSSKEPFVIPVRLGFLGDDGAELTARLDDGAPAREWLLTLEEQRAAFVLTDIATPPVLSLLRDFSAPVTLDTARSGADLLTLARHDPDPFNRWDAAQTLASDWLLAAARKEAETDPALRADVVSVYGEALARSSDEPAFVALMLTPPAEGDIARQLARDVDPDLVMRARTGLLAAVGAAHRDALAFRYGALGSDAPYAPDADGAGRRALRNVTLDLLARADRAEGAAMSLRQYEAAANMTDRIAALSVLAMSGDDRREGALADFERRYGADPLVMDKWFGLQASLPEEGTLDRVERLLSHPAFSAQNPNRVRALVGAFASNTTQFHRRDGAGYRFLARYAAISDRRNPQLAARLMTAFRTWRMMTGDRRTMALNALDELRSGQLSSDLADIVGRMTAGEPSD